MSNKAFFSDILSRGLVFVDTCFIIEKRGGFEPFVESFQDQLKRNPIILLKNVYDECEKKYRETRESDIAFSNHICNQCKLINRLIEMGLIRKGIDSTHQPTFADPVFLRIIQQYHPSHEICILTNDGNLRKDIYRILEQKSIAHHHRISVLGLFGKRLVYWDTDGSEVIYLMK